MKRFPPATLQSIEAALAIVAEAIETHPGGDVYWPIFERLEREREAMLERPMRLARARARVIDGAVARKPGQMVAGS